MKKHRFRIVKKEISFVTYYVDAENEKVAERLCIDEEPAHEEIQENDILLIEQVDNDTQ